MDHRAIFSRLFAAIDRANRQEIYSRHVEARKFIANKGSTYLIITLLEPGATEAAQKTASEKLMREALTKIRAPGQMRMYLAPEYSSDVIRA